MTEGQEMEPILRTIRGPRGYPFVGHFPEFLRDKLGFLSHCAAQYGDVVRLKIGRPMFLLNSPADIQHVLMTKSWNYDKTPRLTSVRGKRISGDGVFTSQGAAHLNQRRLLQPVFYRKAIEAYGTTVVTAVENMLAEWRSDAELDIAAAMMRLTQGIMLKTLFGLHFTGDTGELAEAITIRRRYFEYTLSSIVPFAEYFPSRTVREHRRAIKTIDNVIYRAIHERRVTGLSDDLLSRLMQTKGEDGTTMTDKQIRDEALTFMNSGYETIGAALTWTCYLLAQHPEAEGRLFTEVCEMSIDTPLRAEDQPQLRYAGMVLAESLRLYPPTWMFIRVARHPDILPSGTAICAGAKLCLCPYVMHRHPSYFPQPERFDPERFDDNAKHSRPRFAYFPFGGGPHTCIGEAFARMESLLVLTSLVRRFHLRLLPGQTIVPEPGVFLRPRNGILVRIESRVVQ